MSNYEAPSKPLGLVGVVHELENYKLLINEFGNLNLGNNKDTQYGELYGLYLALLIAKQNKNNNSYSFISGDNILVPVFKDEIMKEIKVNPDQVSYMLEVCDNLEESEEREDTQLYN